MPQILPPHCPDSFAKMCDELKDFEQYGIKITKDYWMILAFQAMD